MSAEVVLRDGCDCHVHVVGPKDRYPLPPGRSYTPPDAALPALTAMLDRLGLARVVLVQPSFYGTDNRCLLDALDALGARARGVAVVAEDASPAELDEFHRRGVRALRINVVSTGPSAWPALQRRIAAYAALCARNGWHLEMFNTAPAIAALAPTLRRLPVPVVIDHFGLIDPARPNDGAARAIIDLLDHGHVTIKLSAPYRITADAFDPRVGALARRLAQTNPQQILWGSDWPHTPGHGAPGRDQSRNPEPGHAETPYRAIDTRALLTAMTEWLADDPDVRDDMLVRNPAVRYGF